MLFTRPKVKKPKITPEECAPRYCHSCGEDLVFVTEDIGFDVYSGKANRTLFVQCPDIDVKTNHETWDHSRYQWMEGNGENSTWLPLDPW